ncbi:putative Ig domain-containing protein [Ochrobactrum sp. POC9]|uniref:putative Ig domain-containing protein n=1 Tax=Ochrobactrum sp. POC9 TaxID=2203419 RepID=UPI0011B290BF|nr:putative Ig domain-containing protein [Ochrobactrum sp. POC9]
MKHIIYSAIFVSLLASTASAAYAETKFIFRYPTGSVTPTLLNEEPETPDNITFNFAPSPYCVGNNVSMTGLVQDGHSVSLESGALPTGLDLSGTSISGTASVAGTFSNILFRVTTSKGSSEVFGPYSMHISDLPKPTTTPQQILTNQNYSYSIPVSGGTAPYAFELVGGVLPNGLQLSSAGSLSSSSGIETAGDFDLSIRVTDRNGCRSTDDLYVSVASYLADAQLENFNPPFYAGEPVSFKIVPQGGEKPIDFAVISPVPWLTVHEDGTVTGTPTAAGDYRLEVAITDSALFPQTKNAAFQFSVTNREVARNFSNNDGAPVTVQSLFTAEEWASTTTDKVANVPSDVILGSSNPAQAAVSIGSQWAGKLTLNVAGQIQGAGGKPGVNGGNGGDALAVNAKSTSDQDLIITGSSRILAGGGGGGVGGKGGDGIVSQTTTVHEPATGESYTVNVTELVWQNGPGYGYILWNGAEVAGSRNNVDPWMSSFTKDGYTYYVGSEKTKNAHYAIYRTKSVTTQTPTTGGDGGSGGVGQGYNQAAGTGVNGVAGGTNAGTGGKGGNGGAFGQPGAAGSPGANGTSTTGVTGSSGGTAGTAIVNAAGATINYIN